MRNLAYVKKHPTLSQSKVYLNKYFVSVTTWNVDQIVKRGQMLAERAALIWSGPKESNGDASKVKAPGEPPGTKEGIANVLDKLGGVKEEIVRNNYQFHRLNDGRVVYVKYSKRHTDDEFWYGVAPGFLAEVDNSGCEDIVLVFATDGFARFPLHLLKKVMLHANKSEHDDGTVKHYHLSVSESPGYQMYTSADSPRVALQPYFHPLDGS
jgi:hypothetical protein